MTRIVSVGCGYSLILQSRFCLYTPHFNCIFNSSLRLRDIISILKLESEAEEGGDGGIFVSEVALYFLPSELILTGKNSLLFKLFMKKLVYYISIKRIQWPSTHARACIDCL